MKTKENNFNEYKKNSEELPLLEVQIRNINNNLTDKTIEMENFKITKNKIINNLENKLILLSKEYQKLHDLYYQKNDNNLSVVNEEIE